eukprot:gnl/Spiro4/5235_TR2642_c0_g1_i1.p1 gnl/Spiro4/5235_TR2642_c0_g1~~gnl/Spiro4/5235_TR2642_c0_g1_i1.p1  ORF type:complete len:160 (-),score=35.42 gnl/Spiro4/5235_TR2642_c0_g1_i1:124-603(-)
MEVQRILNRPMRLHPSRTNMTTEQTHHANELQKLEMRSHRRRELTTPVLRRVIEDPNYKQEVRQAEQEWLEQYEARKRVQREQNARQAALNDQRIREKVEMEREIDQKLIEERRRFELQVQEQNKLMAQYHASQKKAEKSREIIADLTRPSFFPPRSLS